MKKISKSLLIIHQSKSIELESIKSDDIASDGVEGMQSTRLNSGSFF